MYCGSIGVGVIYAEEASVEACISLQCQLAAGAMQVINVNILCLFIGHGDVTIIQGEVFQIAVAVAVLAYSMPGSFVGECEVNGTIINRILTRTALVEIACNTGSISVQIEVNDGSVGCMYVTNDYNIVSCTLVDVDNSVGM